MTVERILNIAASTNPGCVIIAAALLAAFARDVVTRGVAMIGAPLTALLVMLYPPIAGGDINPGTFLGFAMSVYRPDSLSLIFGLCLIIAAALSGVYAMHRRDTLQDVSSLVFAGSAVGAVFAGDILIILIFAELATLASLLLVLAGRTSTALRAGLRCLAFQSLAGLFMTAGVALYGATHGTFMITALGSLWNGILVSVLDPQTPAGLLIFLGVAIKAGFPLLHNWLTDAHANTTESGAVALSPYTTTLAVYLLIRFFAGYPPLVWIGAVMTVYPLLFAGVENDLRKVLAYSTNCQTGFMVCAVGMGTTLSINGAAAHAVTHVIFNGLLLMAIGAVRLRTGTTKLSELGGLHRSMPWTALACLVGAASISALPLLAGYSSRSMIMTAAESGGQHLFAIWIMLLFASAGVLMHSGIKIPYFTFFSHDSGRRAEEAPFSMLLAMGLSAALCLAIGLYPGWLYSLLPFRDQAQEFLAHDLFSLSHLMQQGQLLVFGVIAFMLLLWLRLYPAEQPGLILDVEWLWRKGGTVLGRRLESAARPIRRSVRDAGLYVMTQAHGLARQAFGPDGVVSRTFPLSATALGILAALGLILLLVIRLN